MSAFVVDEMHIHVMVNAGLAYPMHGDKLRWLVRELTDEEKVQSYTRGEPWGPGATAIYGQLRRELTSKTAGFVGAMLWAENVRSVNHRYSEEEWEQPYQFKTLRGVPNPLAVLKAIACYEYQSCEHEDWEESESYRFCQSLRKAAINKLPGYDEMPWEIDESDLLQVMRWQ